MKYKVMIVEDQTMPRELFELRIQASEHFETALSIDNAALADVYCLRLPVDLILMDVITRGGESGLDAAARIKRAFPQINIIIVTSMPECSYLEVLREMTGGDTNQEIAERLHMSVATVKSHILNMLEKTGFKNRTELAVRARESGLVILNRKN